MSAHILLTFLAAIMFTSLTVSVHRVIRKLGTCYFLPLILNIPVTVTVTDHCQLIKY